jgi:hypothetical protein
MARMVGDGMFVFAFVFVDDAHDDIPYYGVFLCERDDDDYCSFVSVRRLLYLIVVSCGVPLCTKRDAFLVSVLALCKVLCVALL